MKRSSGGNTATISLTEDGRLTKKIEQEGEGDVIPGGVVATVHYTGTLEDGTVFDSSVRRGKPFEFNLGAREVILGWDKGVASMRKGERCILKCSPEYAYGNRAIGPIPQNSTLNFEVELLGWKEKSADIDYLMWAIFIMLVATIALGGYLYFQHNQEDWEEIIGRIFPAKK